MCESELVEIKTTVGDNIDSVVKLLIKLRKKGVNAFCNFNGEHMLYSKDVTLDSAYLEITGMTKKDFEFFLVNESCKASANLLAQKEREKKCKRMVSKSRKNGVNPVTSENVISGVKFICEHPNLDQMKLVKGLLDLGCNYKLKEIPFSADDMMSYGEGMLLGNINCGASFIVNSRDSEYGRGKCADWVLDLDNENSAYNFVRVTTGDSSFTKENIVKRLSIGTK